MIALSVHFQIFLFLSPGGSCCSELYVHNIFTSSHRKSLFAGADSCFGLIFFDRVALSRNNQTTTSGSVEAISFLGGRIGPAGWLEGGCVSVSRQEGGPKKARSCRPSRGGVRPGNRRCSGNSTDSPFQWEKPGQTAPRTWPCAWSSVGS